MSEHCREEEIPGAHSSEAETAGGTITTAVTLAA